VIINEKLTGYSTYAASGASIILGFMNQYAAALGILIAMITLFANLYFKWQIFKLAKKNGRKLSDEITDS